MTLMRSIAICRAFHLVVWASSWRTLFIADAFGPCTSDCINFYNKDRGVLIYLDVYLQYFYLPARRYLKENNLIFPQGSDTVDS